MKHYYTPNINIPGNILPIERFMKFEEDTYDVLGSVYLENIQKAVSQDGELRVLENECRFDNLAHEYLGDSHYWWALMEYNDYIDWELTGDKVLKIPNPTDLLVFEQEMILIKNANEMD